ncbi:MAG TPA: CPBP family intramembrane glutamic endopeptidase [Ktedonobacterales bacterium]
MTTQERAAIIQPPKRSTPADSWRWLRLDLPTRALPLLLAPLVVAWLFHLPLAEIGLPALSWSQAAQQIGLGLAIGIPFGALTAAYRAVILPRYRLPTLADHLFQSGYYLFLNAPAEELFYRGLVLTFVARWSGSLALGWLVSTAAYALYHRLGGWGWLSIAGVGLAGALFGVLYIIQPAPRSILLPVVVHGLTTCAFLNLGEVAAYARQRLLTRRNARA